jgi:hypothetical protein
MTWRRLWNKDFEVYLIHLHHDFICTTSCILRYILNHTPWENTDGPDDLCDRCDHLNHIHHGYIFSWKTLVASSWLKIFAGACIKVSYTKLESARFRLRCVYYMRVRLQRAPNII